MVIVLSVLIRITASDDPFGILKLFFILNKLIVATNINISKTIIVDRGTSQLYIHQKSALHDISFTWAISSIPET